MPTSASTGLPDLSDLPVFIAVARQRSFALAARRTGIPTSTVSRAVSRLEETLGVRLFERTSRRVELTQEGLRLLERAAPLADELAEILGEVADREHEPAGRLRVTAPLVSGAGPIGRALLEFAERHRRVSLELSLTNATVDLVEQGFDLAFRAGPIDDPSLVVRRLWTIPSVLAASPAFVRRELRGRTRLTRDELAKIHAVTTNAGPWRFRRRDGAIEDVTPNERVRVSDPRVAVDAARRGLGVVRVVAEAIAGTELVTLSSDIGELEPRELYAAFPSRRLMPMRVRMAIDWVVANAKPMATQESPEIEATTRRRSLPESSRPLTTTARGTATGRGTSKDASSSRGARPRRTSRA